MLTPGKFSSSVDVFFVCGHLKFKVFQRVCLFVKVPLITVISVKVSLVTVISVKVPLITVISVKVPSITVISVKVPLISLDNSVCQSQGPPTAQKNQTYQVWPNIVKRTFQNINIRPRQQDQENQVGPNNQAEKQMCFPPWDYLEIK